MAENILDNPLTPRFTEALALVCELHRSQARKGTQIPYVSHLLAVASLALEYGATEDEAIAAVLHDAVEDQAGEPTAQGIENRFGKSVADIVRACSVTHRPAT
jgi:(p)ppGpp synthase/HD superfamily hydrolase